MKFTRETILKHFLEQEDETAARVAEGIEKNRKADAAVRLLDADGAPLRGLRVRARQTRHAFKHGANLFMLGEFGDAARDALYGERFAEAFNLATLPFYWCDLEPEPGRTRYGVDAPAIYRRPPPDRCLAWCEAHGVEPKAHCLDYPKTTPAWAHGTPEREWALLDAHFADLAARYAARIPMWEVTNELYWEKDFGSSIYYGPEFLQKNFRLAARHFPGNHLVANESTQIWGWNFRGDRGDYFLLLDKALREGARVDAAGLQFHLCFCEPEKYPEEADKLLRPDRIFKVMDTYATLGIPLQVTEVTVPMWDATPEAEALQAETLRRLYEIWFSHGAMEAVIYWNLPDGYGYGAEPGDFTAGENRCRGGLLRHDLSPKPAYDVVRDLFGKTWRTDLTLETDAAGVLRFRGFRGDYELTATLPDGRPFRAPLSLRRSRPDPAAPVPELSAPAPSDGRACGSAPS